MPILPKPVFVSPRGLFDGKVSASCRCGVVGVFFVLLGMGTVWAEDVQVKQNNFAYGVTLRQGYDSNVNTSQHDPQGSFTSTVVPDFNLAWSSPTTDVSLHYTYSATYYSNRPGNDFDQSHDFLFNLAHEFSPRMRVTMNDEFTPGYEPNVNEGDRQFNGNFIQNRFTLSPSYNLGGRWELPLSFAHYFIKYDDSGISETLNRQTYTGTVGVKYNVSSKTSVGVNVGYDQTIYEGFNRSSEAESVTVNLHHAVGPRLSFDLAVGGEMTAYDVNNKTEYNPTVNASAIYTISPRTSMNLQFNTRMQQTEVTQYLAQRSYTISGGMVHQFTDRFMGSFNLMYVPSQYDSSLKLTPAELAALGGAAVPAALSGGKETLYGGGFNLSYQFSLHLRGELGYNHFQVTSDFAERSYERDLTYVQMRLGF